MAEDPLAKAQAFAANLAATHAAAATEESSDGDKKRTTDGSSDAPAKKRRSNWDQPAPDAAGAAAGAEAVNGLATAAAAGVAGQIASAFAQGGGQEVVKQLAVPNQHVGSIIGKGGAVIKLMISQSGAQIKLQQREDMVPGAMERGVTLSGTQAQVDMAASLITQRIEEARGAAQAQTIGGPAAAVGVSTQKHIMVPNASVGGIIGRGGAVIKQLIAESGCQIQIQQKDQMAYGATERGVTLTGTPSQIAIADQKIQEILNGTSTLSSGGPGPMGSMGGPGTSSTTMQVPNNAVGGIIGKGGAVIKQLIAQSGCRIQIQQRDEMAPGATDRGVTLTGTQQQIEMASQMIMKCIAEATGPGGAPDPYGAGGGYGAPPAQQAYGYGAPPAGYGYGAPPPGYGYGAPPAGYGYGAPPPQQGGAYGAPPPQQAYGAYGQQPAYGAYGQAGMGAAGAAPAYGQPPAAGAMPQGGQGYGAPTQ